MAGGHGGPSCSEVESQKYGLIKNPCRSTVLEILTVAYVDVARSCLNGEVSDVLCSY